MKNSISFFAGLTGPCLANPYMVALVLKTKNLPLLVFCENLRSFVWYIGNRHTPC